jgi:hypothetical protein
VLGKVAAGLAGLGLIGGVETVVYNNHGDATVQIKNNKTGREVPGSNPGAPTVLEIVNLA